MPSDILPKSQIAAIILAAGASTRMGTPKQLLPWQGRSLLRSITETAISAHCHPIIVVLGAYSVQIQPEVRNLPVQVVDNPEWQIGMGSSISKGIQALLDQDIVIDATILLLCDQPLVSLHTIQQMRSIYEATHQPIVAATYDKTIGVPALFHAKLFSELADLHQLEGAKIVIQRHLSSVATFDFPQGAIDIDSPQEYQLLLKQFDCYEHRNSN
jgi:molybdenum cofactor cytidylyltransferase